MIIAVTGATGFIGRHLCNRLLASGHVVRALARRPDHGLPAPVNIIHGELTDTRALTSLTTDINALVHLAGATRGIDRAAFDAVNIAATHVLLATLQATAPEAHLIHVSTLAAREPLLSHYAASKCAAEALVLEARLAAATILRPTAVYGPGDVELQPLFELMAHGFAPVPGDAGNRVTLIHVEDLISAILATLTVPSADPGPYELCDSQSDGYTWYELAAVVGRHCGRPVRLIRIPRALLTTTASINLGLARLSRRAPMLTPGKIRELTHPDWSCESAPFASAFSWHPRIGFQDGLATILP